MEIFATKLEKELKKSHLNFVKQGQMLVVPGHLEHNPVLQVQDHSLLVPVVPD